MSPTMLDDGIHAVVHRDHYDRIERVNFSTLKWMARSPAHCHHVMVTPPEDSDPKKLGRVSHLAVFEPERFRASVAVWDGAARRGKDWEAFKERNEGLELLTTDQYDRCLGIQQSVRNNREAKKYLSGGKAEVTMLWSTKVGQVELRCKGRIDFATGVIADLKTTKDGSVEGFGRQAHALHYEAQAAWYSDGHVLAGGSPKPYVIVAVESTAPYVAHVYPVPEQALQVGREKYRAWLDVFSYCRERNEWPGYANDEETPLQLPSWAMPDNDIGDFETREGMNDGAQEE